MRPDCTVDNYGEDVIEMWDLFSPSGHYCKHTSRANNFHSGSMYKFPPIVPTVWLVCECDSVIVMLNVFIENRYPKHIYILCQWQNKLIKSILRGRIQVEHRSPDLGQDCLVSISIPVWRQYLCTQNTKKLNLELKANNYIMYSLIIYKVVNKNIYKV